MKLAISNIAWDQEKNEEIYSLMHKYGFTGLEIAPTKVFNSLSNIAESEILSFLVNLKNKGIAPVAMQALLFGKPELKLFNTHTRQELLQHLQSLVRLGEKLGIQSLVFGSPKNRIYEEISYKEAIGIGVNFFRELGDYATCYGVYICIEPNPTIYGGNFMCNTRETLDFVKEINHNAIKLHLDMGTILVNNEDINILSEAKDYITHFHFSEPNLEVLIDRPEYKKAIHLLSGYGGYFSIEMKNTSTENIENSMKLISNLFK